MYPIYRKCAELGLPVVFHAGYDPISPDVTHCTPEAAAEVFDKVPELTMILAHGGGMRLWDDVEKYLAGKPGKLYFDVSVIAKEISGEQLYRIIKAHGADRILFGSDCPWDTPQNEIKMINDLPLSDEEKELMYLKFSYKYRYKELAKYFNTTEYFVKKKVASAVQKLMKYYKEERNI